jgi:ABC-type dipeptide/oligopeptide/nickel transport system permease subunit
MAALVTIIIVYSSGLFAPWVAPYSHTEQNLDAANQGPSLAHPLGTDRLGRDILSRIIWGARTAAIISMAAVGTGSILFGVILGCLAGYLGRWVDTVIMRLGDVFLAFPSLLLVILIAATVKPRVVSFIRQLEESTGIEGLAASGVVDYFVVFGALSLIAWVGMARLVRGQILSLRERQFVEAAEVMGATTSRILFVHLMPNVLSPVLVAVSMAMGSAVTSEVVLSWLGVGIQPPNASWGTMIWENAGMLRAHPHLLLVPSMVVGIVIFSFNILGDGLNDALNPRTH